MTLGQKQRLFTRLIGKLIQAAYEEFDLELSFGDAYRSPQEAARLGFSNSNHTKRLAVDFNLFKDGVYQPTTKAHKQLGEWWEKQHPLCRWGGRFNDGNHYSLEHDGVK